MLDEDGRTDSEREMAAKDMTRVKQMKERQKGEEIRWQQVQKMRKNLS